MIAYEKTIQILVGLFVLPFMVNSCTTDANHLDPKESECFEFQSIYGKLMGMPGVSILNESNTLESTRGNLFGYPCVTNADIEYLASLGVRGMEELRDSLVSAAGGVEVMDSIQVANYMSLYDEITEGGKYVERMQKLKDFCVAYLCDPECGLPLTRSSEQDLNDLELQIYAQQAATIDRVYRPIYDHISMEGMQAVSERKDDQIFCLLALGTRLSIAGLSIGATAFLDAMTGGVETPMLIAELATVGCDAVGIWLDYEACNGRYH